VLRTIPEVEGIADETVRWIELSTGQRVEWAQHLVGGMSSDVHQCWCNDGSTFVVRCITDRDWLAREPYLIAQEARALSLLAGSNIAAPQLIASDAGAGRLLMTFLPGRVAVEVDEVRSRAHAFGVLVATIAGVNLAPDHGLSEWRSWVPTDLIAPSWGKRSLWQAAIDAFLSRVPPPPTRQVLLHRDLHPLNVLWDNGEVSGVVDWVNACVGHPHAELGHCRWNFALLAGAQAAGEFLASYLSAANQDHYDRWWDIAAALSLLPGPIGIRGWHAVGRSDLTEPHVIAATEEFISSALNYC
jgi:aminoglycoside phosphotransferase (APT) family kinase protein